jgi:hypothetical protein
MISFNDAFINEDTKFSYSGFFLIRKDDLISLIKLCVRSKINIMATEGRIYVGRENNLKSIKEYNMVYDNNFSMIHVCYLESKKREISKIIECNGYHLNFLGDDGSWLANPYYLITGKKSINEIKDLVKNGFLKNLTSNLWRIS